ncbi:hypothetical protein Taro_038197 [Colocasia esculenta]|uniref:GDSL esterase/lipase EXL3 n=1 Tax=Colocasia esculenta TaxID=4460 RepID=A0A843WLH3_COLES|nr:hypothetical protein [Colocasia esculenta]
MARKGQPSGCGKQTYNQHQMAKGCPEKSPLAVLCCLVVLVLRLRILLAMTPLSANQTKPKVPALIVFGDSIVDPGNNNAILTTIRCNFPPYGKDFPGRVATGRFSNGKIPSDFLASKLGIKELLPAYLGTDLDAHDLLTGVSFASGGAGYDPLTSKLVSAISMSDQLKLFKEYKEKLKAIAGEKKAADIISKSLFVVVSGTDDIANTYFTTPFRRLQYDLPSYIEFVVRLASSFLQELHGLGARKIGVAGAPPIGCVPSQRTIAGGNDRRCVSLYNQAAVMMNNRLIREVQTLNATCGNTTMMYIDLYTPLLDLIQRPSAYGNIHILPINIDHCRHPCCRMISTRKSFNQSAGNVSSESCCVIGACAGFAESTKGCCGTGTFEVTLTCNSLTASTCEDVSKYVFWDRYHPTERAAEILMEQVMQRYGSALN